MGTYYLQRIGEGERGEGGRERGRQGGDGGREGGREEGGREVAGGDIHVLKSSSVYLCSIGPVDLVTIVLFRIM